MKKYCTLQRQQLLDFLQKNSDRQYSVEEIAERLKEQSISVSAIYRNMSSMAEEGLVGKFPADGNRGFTYRYIGNEECGGHLHLKCDRCGQIYHMENSSTEQLLLAALNQNAFRVDKRKTVLYGSCRDCKL